LCYVFFFSSRRRHTRLQGDWSSDVCSSDLLAVAWILVVAKSADPKQLTLNEFAYFLAIWAIRAPLAAAAPKAPLLMDYMTMGLYVLLIGVAVARLIWGFRKPWQLEEKIGRAHV